MTVTSDGGTIAVDILHNVVVPDPYRWLENRHLSETDSWIARQQSQQDIYFGRLEYLEALKLRVRECLDTEWRDQVVKSGPLLFFRHHEKGSAYACICMSDNVTGEERVLINPTVLGHHATVDIHAISADGSLLAYELRHNGSDASEIHVLDTVTGSVFADHLPHGYRRGFTFAADNSGFWYCHEFENGSENHMIRFHRFGSTIAEDDEVFFARRRDLSQLVLISDDDNLGAVYKYDSGNGAQTDVYIAARCDTRQWKPLSLNSAASLSPFLHHGRAFVLTDQDAPNGKIVEMLPSGSTTTIVPQFEFPIQRVCFLGGSIFLSYIIHRATHIHEWSLNGTHLGQIDIVATGALSMLSHPRSKTSLFFSVESLAEPPKIYEYDTLTGCPHSKFTANCGPLIDCCFQEVRYAAKDGTAIPMLLITRAGIDTLEPRPTVLTTYGGFGVSVQPKFSVLMAILLELGVTIAMPSIRGGADFGKSWHEAARGKYRQVAFDDYTRAAEWLIETEITRSDKLALYGASNAGLMVAVAMTQRPELFRAVVCIGPLLDMVRYERFDRARKWIKEYGSVVRAEDFSALLRYSPYHHVDEHLNYPAVLFVSGDSDDRCNPSHVRKMAALLQGREAQTNPVLVDYDKDRGHRSGLPLNARVDSIARRLAFLANELRISVQMGGDHDLVCS